MAAIVALLMVLNFHFATSAFWSIDFLRDGTGLPVLGGAARACHQRVAAAIQRSRGNVEVTRLRTRPDVH